MMIVVNDPNLINLILESSESNVSPSGGADDDCSDICALPLPQS